MQIIHVTSIHDLASTNMVRNEKYKSHVVASFFFSNKIGNYLIFH